MANYTYSSEEVVVTAGGTDLRGYGDTDFVNIEYNEDSVRPIEGADNEVTWSVNASTLATVTITLMASSPSNDVLSALHITDRATKVGTFPVFVKDTLGRDLFISSAARIVKFPAVTKSKDVGTREWVLSCADCQLFVGGN